VEDGEAVARVFGPRQDRYSGQAAMGEA